MTSPVTSFTAQGRYVWFAWANYDGTSTGVGRMDVQTFIDDLAPAYASDLMVTAQATSVNLCWDVIQGAPLISLSAPTTGTAGTYSSDPANLVTSGYVDSGWITYGIPDNKTLVAFHPDVHTSAGSVTTAILADIGNGASGIFNTIAQDTSTNNTLGQRSIINPFITGVQFRNKITLGRASATSGPVLARWTLEGLPQIASETTLTPVLSLFRATLINGQEVLYDPYAEYFRLDTLRRNKTPVTYIEGPLSATVIIDSIDWLPEKLQTPNSKGYDSVAVVTLNTLNGFTYTPIPTHF